MALQRSFSLRSIAHYSIITFSLISYTKLSIKLIKEAAKYVLPKLFPPMLTTVLPYGYVTEAVVCGLFSNLLPKTELSYTQKILQNKGFAYTSFLLNMFQGAATSLAFTYLKGKFMLGAVGSLLSVVTSFAPGLIVCIIVVPFIVDKLAEKICDLNGINIDVEIDEIKQTQFHEALRTGDIKKLGTSINEGANIDVPNEYGYTLLHVAVEGGYSDTVKLLLNEKGNIDVKDKSGRTPLHLAAYRGSNVIVECLLNKGANINAIDMEGYTPLHHAALSGETKVVECLLSKGTNIDVTDAIGYTPLHWAAYVGDNRIVEFLLNKDANVNAKSKKGHTPLHCAAVLGDSEIIKLLLSKGLDRTIKDYEGYTALDIARNLENGKNKTAIIDLLEEPRSTSFASKESDRRAQKENRGQSPYEASYS